jgi:hypothetical protein
MGTLIAALEALRHPKAYAALKRRSSTVLRALE